MVPRDKFRHNYSYVAQGFPITRGKNDKNIFYLQLFASNDLLYPKKPATLSAVLETSNGI